MMLWCLDDVMGRQDDFGLGKSPFRTEVLVCFGLGVKESLSGQLPGNGSQVPLAGKDLGALGS